MTEQTENDGTNGKDLIWIFRLFRHFPFVPSSLFISFIVQFLPGLLNSPEGQCSDRVHRDIFRLSGRPVVKFDLAFIQLLRSNSDLERKPNQVSVVELNPCALIAVIVDD